MKKGILFALMIAGFTVTVNAQTLKDLLYGGKLKNDSGSVVRKSDDLSTKIDTTKKKVVETEKPKIISAAPDYPVKKELQTTKDSVNIASTETNENPAEKKDNNNTVKDNNKLWKEYMDSVISTLKTEVLPSKKIKKGIYYVMVDYTIGTDGQVTINNVYPAPDNSFLQEQVKERLTLSAPKLNPVVWSNGQPHKAAKRYNFTLSKE